MRRLVAKLSKLRTTARTRVFPKSRCQHTHGKQGKNSNRSTYCVRDNYGDFDARAHSPISEPHVAVPLGQLLDSRPTRELRSEEPNPASKRVPAAVPAQGAARGVTSVGADLEVIEQGSHAFVSQDTGTALPVHIVHPVLHAEERMPAPVVPTAKLEVQDVPEAVAKQPMPLLRIIMPVVMIFAMLAMVGFMIFSGSSLHPMMLLFPLMMGMSMLMMLQPPQANNIDEQRRTYLRHLVQLREQALANASRQRASEIHWHCSPATLWSLLGTPRMWERLSTDPQFGVIRIGTGTVPLCTPLEPQQSAAVEDLDPVCAVSLRHLLQRVNTVSEMPVTLQLAAFPMVALRGERAREAAYAIVAQLVCHHGPENLNIRLHDGAESGTDSTVVSRWEWLKWLPHFTPSDQGAAPALCIAIWDCGQTTLAKNWEQNLRELQRWASTVIIIGESEELCEIALAEGIVVVAGDSLAVLTESGEEVIGNADGLSEVAVSQMARLLARYRRPGSSAEHSLDLRNLLRVPQLDAAAISQLWREQSHDLNVPIGCNAYGKPLRIDIKEAALGGMGPHGLCIGATGSGKSELLRTLVVALAATHSPDDLNLVLVDFKGGATFLGLEGLPHTSAVITNLAAEATLVERMHDAISGEMQRRQEMLRQAGNYANVREYNAQRPAGTPPIPALFIIVDEFSELLGQHPDFADLFVAVGRLGRSLQIHLLLASQRLDEGRLRGLESHLSYRIGLKTFSAAESRQILGTLDAFELPQQPGLGFLRTDSGQPLRFRASYVSGQVQETKTLESHGVRLFQMYEQTAPVLKGATHTLVDDCVQACKQVAHGLRQKAHQIWLPPLPAKYPFAQLRAGMGLDETSLATEPGDLAVPCGLIDRPFHQRQDILELQFSGQHGHAVICGGPQTGKSTALRTLIMGLCQRYGPELVRCYVLDFGGGGLANCVDLPQVVAVAHKQEKEKVVRIITEVHGLLDRPAPWHTFLFVDGWATLAKEFEDSVDTIATLVSEGLAVGVHVVLSMSRWMDVRPVIRDLIAQRVELKLVEPLDSLIDRQLQAKLPAAPGRGVCQKELILFAHTETSEVRTLSERLQAAGVVPAPGLRMLPTQLEIAELGYAGAKPGGVGLKGLIFALGGKHIEPWAWDPQSQPHLMIFGSAQSGKSTTIETILHAATQHGPERYRVVMIDHRRAHLGTIAPEMLAGYAAHGQASRKLLADTCITLEQRLPPADITPAELQARSWWSGPEILVVIDDADLLDFSLLQRLFEHLPHARDIGLHVIVAHKIGSAAKALFQPFLAEIRDQIPQVIILDGAAEDGPLFHVRPDSQPPGRGHIVVGGQQLGMFQIAQAPEAVLC
ncbi:MAG: type VII secretion protein EccCa [Corynebacterium sp.]|nr:type VII secretion protein EccCa [Corynebacterium sp.]